MSYFTCEGMSSETLSPSTVTQLGIRGARGPLVCWAWIHSRARALLLCTERVLTGTAYILSIFPFFLFALPLECGMPIQAVGLDPRLKVSGLASP